YLGILMALLQISLSDPGHGMHIQGMPKLPGNMLP
ncbi:MAG: hypothetical protein JWM57_1399, partial [Phycisphaerales bacterium]|nr:hypothetical protein [Phycisphaerales bacterium]